MTDYYYYLFALGTQFPRVIKLSIIIIIIIKIKASKLNAKCALEFSV